MCSHGSNSHHNSVSGSAVYGKQHIGLVGEAEHRGGVQPTKVEDLGLWDFQVEDVVKE